MQTTAMQPQPIGGAAAHTSTYLSLAEYEYVIEKAPYRRPRLVYRGDDCLVEVAAQPVQHLHHLQRLKRIQTRRRLVSQYLTYKSNAQTDRQTD